MHTLHIFKWILFVPVKCMSSCFPQNKFERHARGQMKNALSNYLQIKTDSYTIILR